MSSMDYQPRELIYNSFFYHIKPQTIKMSAIHSQSLSNALIVISANIEGLTANKASIISELCKDKHCHCLYLQETHRAKDQARPSIPGIALVAERPHNKHGSSDSNKCEKSVLDLIPPTQHHPICVSVNPVIVAQPTTLNLFII